MEAIILAGGKGTRLQPVVNDVPKPMAEVNGKPFLYYVMEWLKKNAVSKAILAVSYKVDVIKDYFGYRYDGIELEYSYENEPLGTGGAIRQALTYCKSKNVFTVNGDTLFDIDLKLLSEIHDDGLSIACRYEKYADRYGLIKLEDKKVISISEKAPNSSGLINGGVYLIERAILNDYPVAFSFETNAMHKLIKAGKVRGKRFDDYFIDIGIPSDYRRANEELGNE